MNALHEVLLMGAAAPDEPVTLAMAGVISGVAWMERSLRSVIQVSPTGRNDDHGLI